MALERISPTKGNLIETKKRLEFAKMGYDLLDRKRNILIREMMSLIDKATEIQNKIDTTYADAYKALQMANITLGYSAEFAHSVPIETGLQIDYRSVMGIELPTVKVENETQAINYSLDRTNSMLDEAYLKFHNVKILTAEIAEVENSVYLLANAIRKTGKRANALKNIMIPSFEETVKTITEALEEKEREDFSRLTVIKKQSKKYKYK